MSGIGETTKVLVGINPDVISGAVTGPAIDTAGFGEALIILQAGVIAATGTLNCKVQHGDTSGGSFADITGAAFAEILTAGDETVAKGRLKLGGEGGVKRWLKVVLTQATATLDAGALVILAGGVGPHPISGESLDFNVA